MNRLNPAFRSTLACILTTTVAWSSHSLATAQVPSVGGTVFFDQNLNGTIETGEGLGGVSITLFADDGDLLFDMNTDTEVAVLSTDSNGRYDFASLDPNLNYFVHQPAQTFAAVDLVSHTSTLLDPLNETLLIDAFDRQQRVQGNPIVPIGSTNLSGSSMIGGQRDILVEYKSGPAEVVLHADPWGLNHVLQFDQSAGSMGIATVTWDGLDTDMSTTPANGLGGLDLTADGGEAFAMLAGVDQAGAGESLTLRIFSGSDISTAMVPIPVTDGRASAPLYIPFDAFTGTASFQTVDSIQLEIGGEQASIDAQVGPIHVVAGAEANIAVVPEPTAGILTSLAAGGLFLLRRRRSAS